MPDSGTGNRGNSLCWSAPLQDRPGCYRRGAVGEWFAVAGGGVAMRCVSGKICARDSGAGICNPHRIARTGDGRSYAIHAGGPVTESAGPPALRPGCRPGLQAEASRDFGARYDAQIGLERPGSAQAEALKRPSFPLQHSDASTLFSCSNHAFIAISHGSSKTQNVEDARAHAQGGEPLACAAPE
jgi:hypothetical protein